jgi:hypothetical protein
MPLAAEKGLKNSLFRTPMRPRTERFCAVRLSGHSFTRPRDGRINPLEKLPKARLRQSAEIPPFQRGL